MWKIVESININTFNKTILKQSSLVLNIKHTSFASVLYFCLIHLVLKRSLSHEAMAVFPPEGSLNQPKSSRCEIISKQDRVFSSQL